MVSRAWIAAVGALLAAALLAGSSAARPAIGTAVYTVRPDPRLCPSPLCGGYLVALANVARTRCHDGVRRPRCYVAKVVDAHRHPLESAVPEGALARATLEWSDYEGLGRLGVLAVAAVYGPAGTAPPAGGGYYRVVDTGLRCIRDPCFSYRVRPLNGWTRIDVSTVELGAARATPSELARAARALRTKNGLFAKGRFARAPNGGRAFRAWRLFLRAP